MPSFIPVFGDSMAANQEKNLSPSIKFGKECPMWECASVERKGCVSYDECHDCKSVKVSENIVDLLPDDPFGMDFDSGSFDMGDSFSLPKDPFEMNFNMGTTVSTISGWIEDLCSKTCEIEISNEGKWVGDDKLLGELNLVWTSSVKFEIEDGDDVKDEVNIETHLVDETLLYDRHFILRDNREELSCYGCEKYEKEHVADACSDVDGGAPPDALSFVLDYLSVGDLLSVERVCKSLRDAVRYDTPLWRNIHIDYPLNRKCSDEDLTRLTDRAHGSLLTLSLINCKKITNIGLEHVLESNVHLTKLSIPGCTKLSVNRILHDLRIFNSVCTPGIKHIRISDHLGMTEQHLLEFKLLLGVENEKRGSCYKSRFYCEGNRYLSLDDECPIDIEVCPRCKQVRQVYDCPVKSCQAKLDPSETCRACTCCIGRCRNCGCCLDNTDYEETFCLDAICLECLAGLFQRRQDGLKFLPAQTYFHQKASYRFVFCG